MWDSGVRNTHQEFADRVLDGYGADGRPHVDLHPRSHGTRVASIIGGETFGVAKEVWLHSVKIAGNTGGPSTAGYVNGLEFICQHRQDHNIGPAVVNISLNEDKDPDGDDVDEVVFSQAVRNLVELHGITVVVSAGNQELSPLDFAPSDQAPVDGVIVAGGIDFSDQRWRRQETDPDYTTFCVDFDDCGSNFGVDIDLWAPAAWIYSATKGTDTEEEWLSGTSFASPFVTGVVALYLEQNPNATPTQVEQALVANATVPVPPLGDIGLSPNRLLYSGFIQDNSATPFAPVARSDSAITEVDLPVEIRVLDNDTDRNGGPLNVSAVTQDSIGSVTFDGTSVQYTPDPGQAGTDTFSYTVSDGQLTATSTVTVEVVPDLPPIAVDDFFALRSTETLRFSTGQLVENDLDEGPITPLQVFQDDPRHGEIHFAGGVNNWDYFPDPGFQGVDNFRYEIRDEALQRDIGMVFVTVRNPANVPPNAQPDSFTMAQGTALGLTSIQLLANDSDANGDPLVVAGFGAPTVGSISCCGVVQGGFGFTYTPPPSFAGSDTFEYSASDGVAQDAALVTITVEGNNWPTAHDDVAEMVQPGFVKVPVLNNDTDPEGDSLSVVSVGAASHGSLVITNLGTQVKYTPSDPAFIGQDHFTYTISDPSAGMDTAGVSITVNGASNLAPDAREDQLFTYQNQPLTFTFGGLTWNDYDPDGQVSISSLSTDVNGWLTCTGTICHYTPPTFFAGTTTFDYTVTDGAGGEDTAQVKIYVGLRRAAPIAGQDSFTTTKGSGFDFTLFDLLANDSDADGDVLSVRSISSSPNSTVTCSNPVYACSYQPNPGFVGVDHLTYVVTDGVNSDVTAEILVWVVGPPDQPDARGDQVFTYQNQPKWIPLAAMLVNDFDPLAHPLTVSAVDDSEVRGSLTCSTFGCQYLPPTYFGGYTEFRYTVDDGQGNSDEARVRIYVGQRFDPPTAADDHFSTPAGMALELSIFDLLANDWDLQGDSLTVTDIGSPSQGTLSCSRPIYTCTYTPFSGASGSDSFGYTINDGVNDEASAMITIQISP